MRTGRFEGFRFTALLELSIWLGSPEKWWISAARWNLFMPLHTWRCRVGGGTSPASDCVQTGIHAQSGLPEVWQSEKWLTAHRSADS